jgi:hypothetical protein
MYKYINKYHNTMAGNKITYHKTDINANNKKKANIPRALREQVWIQNIGNTFEHKCLVDWCQNKMNVFDFHVGHNIPESHGGETNIKNLKPICARCNLSMSNQYSISEWVKMGNNQRVPVILSKSGSVSTPEIVDNTVNNQHWWRLCC